MSALVTPLVVAPSLLRVEIPLMIGSSVLVWIFALDGSLSRFEGILLLTSFVVYAVYLYNSCKKVGPQECDMDAPQKPPVGSGFKDKAFHGMYIVAGLVLLIIGARWLVDGASGFARELGVSELVISLTIISIGTSIPELVISIVAAARGEREIAVGNVVGSNISNVLVVLGITCLVTPDGIIVEPDALHLGIPVMVAVAVICMPVFYAHGKIIRWEGVLFLVNYTMYISYIVLRAVDHPIVPGLGRVILWLLIPLTVLFLLVSVIREFRKSTE